MKKGEVVTVEPGLYYPGVGAVRIEDLLVITDKGYKNLTVYPKKLEIA
ncbi:MAG TPA: M24 family metallopeptidase [bacterium]|nr:M24 family metallopeptidase [bacterium]